METLFQALRMGVFGAAALSGVVAVTNWAVSRGYLQPFGAWPRFVRRASDPLLRPIERKLLGAGGNPQSAPWWLFCIVLFGGLAPPRHRELAGGDGLQPGVPGPGGADRHRAGSS